MEAMVALDTPISFAASSWDSLCLSISLMTSNSSVDRTTSEPEGIPSVWKDLYSGILSITLLWIGRAIYFSITDICQ